MHLDQFDHINADTILALLCLLSVILFDVVYKPKLAGVRIALIVCCGQLGFGLAHGVSFSATVPLVLCLSIVLGDILRPEHVHQWKEIARTTRDPLTAQHLLFHLSGREKTEAIAGSTTILMHCECSATRHEKLLGLAEVPPPTPIRGKLRSVPSSN